MDLSVEKIRLNENWTLSHKEKYIMLKTTLPSSVFADLISAKLIDDPFYGSNEHKISWVYESEWIYQTTFDLPHEFLQHQKILLKFHGLDTFCSIKLNGVNLGLTENMFRSYEFDVQTVNSSILKETQNHLEITIQSATKRALEECVKNNHQLDTGYPSLPGVPYIRKAPYSFGWDWGPRLPDIGIWKEIELIGFDELKIASIFPKQSFSYSTNQITTVNLLVSVTLDSIPNYIIKTDDYILEFSLCGSDGAQYTQRTYVNGSLNEITFLIQNPQLWWIHELGTPNLYQLTVQLKKKDQIIDFQTQNVGLRDIQVIQKPDKWGETFYFQLNGIPIFAKGADWVPIDNFIPRGQKIGLYSQLLNSAKAVNMNFLRVWGGGIYEHDEFYDLADKLGLLIWQDFMFACSPNPASKEFFENFRIEAIQNIIRLRTHPSLAIWVGNNECEEGWTNWHWNSKHPAMLKQAYLDLFEKLIPDIIKIYDPTRFYWPSSPSSGGNFQDPTSQTRGDAHFWKVWHGRAPFSDYHQNFSRFMSEFGFESFPSMKTIATFCPPDQYRFDSPIMNNHQKNRGGNEKILWYMKKRYSIPTEFSKQVILSQITQAEAMEYGVEHWRRNRTDFRCMGALYWQFNDCWPVASWAAVDYFVRWKALNYFTKRFYSPIFASVVEDKKFVEFWLTNDKNEPQTGHYTWQFFDSKGNILIENHRQVSIESCNSRCIQKVECSQINRWGKYKKNSVYYEFRDENNVVQSRGLRLFAEPKYLSLLDPHLKWMIDENNATDHKEESGWQTYRLTIETQALALFVFVDSPLYDCICSDNFFPLRKGESYSITIRVPSSLSKEEMMRSLSVDSLYSLTH